MVPKRPSPLSELRLEWYQKLKAEGFIDIEDYDHPDLPLKQFHGFHFVSLRSELKREKRGQYQLKIDTFANDPSFPEILRLMVKHGNSLFTEEEIELIWDMHRNGETERGIASHWQVSKSCIHFLLSRMREWMKLL